MTDLFMISDWFLYSQEQFIVVRILEMGNQASTQPKPDVKVDHGAAGADPSKTPNPHHHHHFDHSKLQGEIPAECPMHKNHPSKAKVAPAASEPAPKITSESTLNEKYKAATGAFTSGGECPIKSEKDQIDPTNMVKHLKESKKSLQLTDIFKDASA